MNGLKVRLFLIFVTIFRANVCNIRLNLSLFGHNACLNLFMVNPIEHENGAFRQKVTLHHKRIANCIKIV